MKLLPAILPIVLLASCSPAMREMTARNNGTTFWLHAHPGATKKMEYSGPVDTQNRAHGFGNYQLPDDFYGGNHFEGSGTFKHGQPDGDHFFRVPSPLVQGYKHYSNGQCNGTTKTHNNMPAHIGGSLMGGLPALAAANRQSSGTPSMAPNATATTDDGPWYPVRYHHRPGMPTATVGGVPLKDGQAILLKPGAGQGWGRIVPGGG